MLQKLGSVPAFNPLNAAAFPFRRIAIVATVVALTALAWLGSLDTMARDYAEAGLKRALITFAAARAANAVISVIQETTVAVAPGGLGVTTSPGQVLDPINDMIEQFSTLMLAASVSLGAQVVLISVGSLAVFSGLVTVGLLAWGFFAWQGRSMPAWLPRVLVLLLFVRFAVPVAALASEAAFRAAMSKPYAEAQTQVDATGKVILGMSNESSAGGVGKEGFIEWTRRWLSDERRSVTGKIDELKTRAEGLIRHVVTLAAVFVVQTMMLPGIFMWLTFRLFGATLRWPGKN